MALDLIAREALPSFEISPENTIVGGLSRVKEIVTNAMFQIAAGHGCPAVVVNMAAREDLVRRLSDKRLSEVSKLDIIEEIRRLATTQARLESGIAILLTHHRSVLLSDPNELAMCVIDFVALCTGTFERQGTAIDVFLEKPVSLSVVIGLDEVEIRSVLNSVGCLEMGVSALTLRWKCIDLPREIFIRKAWPAQVWEIVRSDIAGDDEVYSFFLWNFGLS